MKKNESLKIFTLKKFQEHSTNLNKNLLNIKK